MIDITKERLQALSKLGFNPGAVLDIGAFQGGWSKIVHEIWPKAKIFLIEANVDYSQYLQAKKLGDVEISLLGRNDGEMVTYFASKKEIATGNSIFREQTWYFEDCEERKLTVETLAHLCRRKKWKRFDFIKIDTQGSELEIIAGGEDIIKKAEFVLLETSNLVYNLGAPSTLEVMNKMDKLGFQLFDITEIHHLIPSEEMFQVDMLFARKDSKYIKKGILWQR